MNINQAKELHTLISTVQHVEKMNTSRGAPFYNGPKPACLICEGVRHGFYSYEKAASLRLSYQDGFQIHFGCSSSEALDVLFHSSSNNTRCKKTVTQQYISHADS